MKMKHSQELRITLIKTYANISKLSIFFNSTHTKLHKMLQALQIHNNTNPNENEGNISEENASEINSGILLLISGLLILAVLTIWLLKAFRVRSIHETGLCLLYGIIVGLIIKYAGPQSSPRTHLRVNVTSEYAAPSTLWAYFSNGRNYSYERGEELKVYIT